MADDRRGEFPSEHYFSLIEFLRPRSCLSSVAGKPLTDSEAFGHGGPDYFSAEPARLGLGRKSNIRAVTSVGNVRTRVLKLLTAAM